MFTVFLVIQILVTLALVVLILFQRNDSDGLGSMGGGGGGNSFMTGRGQANLLTRSTAILATIFMLNSLWLAMMASGGNRGASLAEEIERGDAATVSVPLAEDSEGLTEEMLEPEMPVTSTPKNDVDTTDAPEAAPVDAAPAAPEAAAPEAATGETPVVPIP